MQAPQKVKDLVERFDTHVEEYKSGSYNETQVRVDFVDPFFEALGWDIHNEENASESYRDVRHEYSIKTAEGTKAPDYCFRMSGKAKFFLETKKPSVHIKDDVGPAFQIRRYALSKNLPLSLLTDFEEFAVYDCRLRPHKNDLAFKGRVLYYTYKDYIEKWEEIYSRFSREAVSSGDFDKYIEKDLPKKGVSKFDDFFLQDMEKWRDILARNIAIRNKFLTQKELNHLVQATIDRILFLRICEDREIEVPYARLQKLTASDGIYSELTKFFKQADDKYNSGLFHFKSENDRDNPDTLSLKLSIDDKPLKDIIKQLYYPESPYVFSQIPAEILGQVYEKFLGKVIRLTPGHQAKVEFKPEVRKAGGVYYTPKYIVDYIVENTVGELLKKKTPVQAKKLRILDPACGSGSFLLGAYQYLLDWYLEQYKKESGKHKKQIYKGAGDEWFLKSKEKKEILVSNIYGVDIDRQAVEVSKLSLLLKVLEGESNETLESQQRLFQERALPDLSHNIKCGNSLVGTDFFHEKNLDMFARDDMESINAFDWDSKAGFAEIMKAGGFDAVIGNPPYVKEYTSRKMFELVKESHLKKYYQGKMDIWYIFASLSIDLLKEGGYHSFIAQNNWITSAGASLLRKKILSEVELKKFIDFNDYKVFSEAGIQTMVYTIKNNQVNKHNVNYFQFLGKNVHVSNIEECLLRKKPLQHSQNFIANISRSNSGDSFTFINKRENEVIEKIKAKSNYFLDNKDTSQGIVAPQEYIIKSTQDVLGKEYKLGEGIFVLNHKEKKTLSLNITELTLIKPYYTSIELHRYYGEKDNKLWVIYTTSEFKSSSAIKKYPNIKKHLDKYVKVITSDNKPYGLHRSRLENFFIGQRIISLRKALTPTFTYVDFPCYVSQTYNIIKPCGINLKYLTGFLNSSLARFWFHNKGKKQGQILQIDSGPLHSIPICMPKKTKINDMVQLVDQMLDTQKKRYASESEQDKKHYQQKVDILDKQIDTLVYELYELTPAEIKIVEEAR